MSFKGFSIFSSGGHFFSAERNDLSNFGRGSPKEHFCEFFLKSGHEIRRCRLKKLLTDGRTDGRTNDGQISIR